MKTWAPSMSLAILPEAPAAQQATDRKVIATIIHMRPILQPGGRECLHIADGPARIS